MPNDPFTQTTRQELDKFQLATTRFIDTLHAHFSGYSSVTIIDNIRATCELMFGITEHLKKSGHLPSDISLVYSRKYNADEEQDPITSATSEMYQNSRKRSNFSKHADRDAFKTLSYDPFIDVDHFIFNMTVDYETLHCALMKHGLLDNSNEKLYTIKSSLLNSMGKYRDIYYSQYDVPNQGEASSDPMMDFQLRLLHAFELRGQKIECSVPAGVAACAIFRKDKSYFKKEHGAKKFEELGIWPVDTQTSARFTKEIVLRPENTPDI
ncbi:MAG: hypothetical protein ACRBDI_03210 [Alphaproteobacteria bacterium]